MWIFYETVYCHKVIINYYEIKFCDRSEHCKYKLSTFLSPIKLAFIPSLSTQWKQIMKLSSCTSLRVFVNVAPVGHLPLFLTRMCTFFEPVQMYISPLTDTALRCAASPLTLAVHTTDWASHKGCKITLFQHLIAKHVRQILLACPNMPTYLPNHTLF